VAPLIVWKSKNVTSLYIETYRADLYNPEIEKGPELIEKILKQKLVKNLNLNIRRQLI
jgi:hypothetical protein